ncbi:thymidine kinase 2, mitochondrial [Aplysia californica]|uniref:Thymidine kinase 2, mitochondrial n=1 Tax=Aplysia californica TaxID=6500 RepID=A0ABM1VTV1_APLCA|nr:thymidine kinase 2, mitochondrial [Aplysia californica]
MAQSHVRPQTERVRLMERSLFSGRYCFIDNLLQGGKMTTIEHSVLSQWHDWIVDALQIKVDLYVYLRTDPRVIPDRILKRGRVEEKDIPMKYIESIHGQHEDLFIRGMKVYKPNVLVLDANCSKDEMVQLYERHRDQILHTGANSHLPPVQK